MFELVKRMLSSYDAAIEAYEIKGSYCPGSFDLSIGEGSLREFPRGG